MVGVSLPLIVKWSVCIYICSKKFSGTHLVQLDWHVAIEVWLAELAGTLVACTMGGAGIFGSVLDCTAHWLHCVFAAAGLAGVHDWSLGVIHWCATNLGGVAAGACSMYCFCHACIWVWSLLETLGVSVTEVGSGSGFITTLSCRCFWNWQYTAPAVVCTRYDLCHSCHMTVPESIFLWKCPL